VDLSKEEEKYSEYILEEEGSQSHHTMANYGD
jgi:hypothetical protein